MRREEDEMKKAEQARKKEEEKRRKEEILQQYKIKKVEIIYLSTVGENIIATIKIRNNYVAIQSFIYRSSNFAIAKVVALNLFASIFV